MSERVKAHILTLHWLMKRVANEHLQVKPPSTTREAPVTYLASSEAGIGLHTPHPRRHPFSPSGPARPGDDSSLPLHRAHRHLPGGFESSEYSSAREEHSL